MLQQLLDMECGVVEVPMDWANPGGRKIEIALTRLKARKPSKGVVFTNPGGPGAAGTMMPLVFAMRDSRVLESMDVVGIDVRGTGMGSALGCGDPSFLLKEFDPRNRSAKNVKKMLEQNKRLARQCQRHSGALDQYVTTAQTVRDLDRIRQALGQEKIHWVGYSAGTWLGAHYAAAYPRHTGRFVLDSVVDVTRSWQDAFALQPLGFERRFRKDFAVWAAKHNKRYKLGATAAQVVATYEKIRKDVAREPLPLLGSPQELTAPSIDGLIASGMYSGEDFSLVAQVLTTLRRYTGVSARRVAPDLGVAIKRLRERATPLLHMGTMSELAAFFSVTCNDTPHRGTVRQLVERSGQAGRRYPLIGWSTINDPCQFWKRPKTSLKRPGANLPAMLMVQSQHDPATPIEGALNSHRKLRNSRLLTVTKEGTHALYLGGNKCVDRVVEAYLVDGKLPKKDLSCKGLPAPKAVNPWNEPTDLTVMAGPLQRLHALSAKYELRFRE